jgi:TolA-binding protein
VPRPRRKKVVKTPPNVVLWKGDNSYVSQIERGRKGMKNVRIAIAVLVVFLTWSFGYSDVVITYASGTCKVDKEGKGKFVDAAIDMELGTSSIVKTGPNGGLELDIDREAISIGGNSTVKIGDLIAKMNEKKKNGWMSSVSKYTKSIGRGGGSQASTALAGVRGELAVSDDIEWFEEDPEGSETLAALKKGKDLFNEGRYVQAIPVFEDLVGNEDAGSDRASSGGDENDASGPAKTAFTRNEASFYLGVSLFNVLRYKEALPYLETSLADKTADFYEPALFHFALTSYMLERYGEAIEGFERYRDEFTGGSLESYAILMLGKTCRKAGKPKEARSYFLEIQRNYGGTDVSDYAGVELMTL